ncbi:hypothetical protein HQN60_12500 [Deefgea piscis]|uniref:Dephospho-CoA kinase n=1 Tax=Deefgea piscis TaxID=2739061 RepID=A0A6M8STQ2_9NEIS|nr:hypothetical protein [Deefgea piscis]QKJ67458.1 hypothetical protein HQN60_12500 [Deefgea piscis]
MKPQIIIGLTGKAGAGKDTVADYLVTQKFTKIAYADRLRDDVCFAWGIAPELLTERSTKEIPQTALAISGCQDSRFLQHILIVLAGDDRSQWEIEARMPRAPRWIMQRWGDYRRALFGADYFLIELANKIAEIDGHIVVSDVRFDNEAQQLNQLGAWLWQIQRPNLTAVTHHASEQGIKSGWIDCDINNSGTIDHLIENAADKLTLAIFGEKAA